MAECVHKGPGCQKRAGVHINGSKGYTGVSYCRRCASAIFTEPEWNAILCALPGDGVAIEGAQKPCLAHRRFVPTCGPCQSANAEVRDE